MSKTRAPTPKQSDPSFSGLRSATRKRRVERDSPFRKTSSVSSGESEELNGQNPVAKDSGNPKTRGGGEANRALRARGRRTDTLRIDDRASSIDSSRAQERAEGRATQVATAANARHRFRDPTIKSVSIGLRRRDRRRASEWAEMLQDNKHDPSTPRIGESLVYRAIFGVVLEKCTIHETDRVLTEEDLRELVWARLREQAIKEGGR